MSQKLAIGGFKWKKNILKFNRNFIKNYNEDSNKEFILEVDVEFLKYIFFKLMHSFFWKNNGKCKEEQRKNKSISFRT